MQFLKKQFLIIIPKKLDDRVNLENDGIFPSKLPIRSNKHRFMNHSLIFFVNCNQKTFSKKWKKSLKSMHLHEKASLGTTLWLFQKCIKRLEKPFLSNGPHLVSRQYAYKVIRAQNEVTVKPYFKSPIDYHPVGVLRQFETCAIFC